MKTVGRRIWLPWVSKDYYQQLLTTVIDFQRFHSMKCVLNNNNNNNNNKQKKKKKKNKNNNNNNNNILELIQCKTCLLHNTFIEHIFVQLIGNHQEHLLFTNG